MMSALEAGGLAPAYDPKFTTRAKKSFECDGYNAVDEFYELGRERYLVYNFPQGIEGNLLKVFAPLVPTLSSDEYKIVLMTRHPEEIRQSYEAMVVNEFRSAAKWLDAGPSQQREYDDRISMLIKHIAARSDMSAEVVRYREDLLANPLRVFMRLRSCGWPIDAELAASTIDPERCRHKLELLHVGL